MLADVRCAAHTIQLAACDVLKTEEVQSGVDDCRKIVKILRVYVRGGASFAMPPLDNATRWNSTFYMLDSLIKLQSTIEQSEDVNIPDIDWNFVSKFVKAFEPLAHCTKHFQNEQYIIGDFYRDWLCCELKLETIQSENNYAKSLWEAMKKRKENLLENDAFISAIYLDPRFNFSNAPFLNEEAKRKAMVSLIYSQIIKKH